MIVIVPKNWTLNRRMAGDKGWWRRQGGADPAAGAEGVGGGGATERRGMITL